MNQKKAKPSLWALIAISATIILCVLIGVIFTVFRTVVQRRYVVGMRETLENADRRLRDSQFSHAAAKQIEAEGIGILIFRGKGRESYYRSDLGPMFYLTFPQRTEIPATGSPSTYYDYTYLNDLVRNHLGSRDGSVCITEKNLPAEGNLLDSRELYLIGRQGSFLYGMNMPITNANAALDMAIDYAAVIWAIGLGICLIIIFVASRSAARSNKGLIRITEKISNLDFSERCSRARTGDMDSLAQSINRMSDRLQADIAEMQKANASLERELTERKHQQQLNLELVANISHDLKTPIAIISGCAESLQEGIVTSPEQRAAYYRTIAEENDYMLQIVSKMLAITRAESSLPLTPSAFDLSLLLDEVIETYAPEIQKRGLKLDVAYDRPLPAFADRRSIRQCLYQYVQNAVFYVDERKHIRVSAKPDGGSILVSVRNSAAPIPEELAARLWDKLYRGDNARSQEDGRAGIGLAIVKSSLERQGFEYGFRNLDDGVEFWFRIPSAAEQNAAKDV